MKKHLRELDELKSAGYYTSATKTGADWIATAEKDGRVIQSLVRRLAIYTGRCAMGAMIEMEWISVKERLPKDGDV